MGKLPKGITFTPVTTDGIGILQGTPALAAAGTYNFLIMASNGGKVTAVQWFVLNVA